MPVPHNFLPSPNANSITAKGCETGCTLSRNAQDHSLILHHHSGVSETDQLSIIPSRTLRTLEDIGYCVANHLAQEVKQCCLHQGGLANTELVSKLISCTINCITDDPFDREYYFKLIIHQLYPHPMQGNGLTYIPLTTAAQTITSTLPLVASSSSPEPQEAACSPLTSSDVSSNASTSRLMCDGCQRTFARNDSLQRHLRVACTYNKKYTSQHVFAVIKQ
ncbi:hypothetical protein K492DRAFT_189836 [Lichtheimia hyalospora FSU 10163]|nr:hypothetical protein K492DRAFT_189836 [Lichtheimia hyalospora FSU 10163]